ncbi:MAG: ferric reductase-like transmembrane domain-containing protein [Minicystis sp.]
MRRTILVGFATGLVLLALSAAIGARAGIVSIPFERPDGVGSWLASRAAGIAAYLAITLEIVFGLFLSTGAGDRWLARARSIEIHRFLSVAALSLVATHALALLADRFVRFDILAVLVPFVAPYRPFAVGIGAIAAYAVLVVHASFGLRREIGQRAWRALHHLSFVVFVLATAHGLLAGSDAQKPWLRAAYASSTAAVLALVVYRVVELRRARSVPRGPSAHSIPRSSS